ncbi:hypothetical protein LCGC14_1686860 [marine sediment metagenome]|jgi:molybdopterin synthase sulfur carrier subunit|uniref:MoaD family protein n=1 Tax=marine sediment metagenome TaxID=412755 RepID=A0A0F9HM18_9ZZZZ
MANVTLKLVAIFTDDVGLTYINYDNVDTLGEIINQFMDQYGRKIRKSFVDSQGKLENHAIILVNGRNHLFLDGLDTKLRDGDEIVLSPPIVGG